MNMCTGVLVSMAISIQFIQSIIKLGLSSKGAKLNKKLKLRLQNELELRSIKEYLSKEDVQDVLKINEMAHLKLLKAIKVQRKMRKEKRYKGLNGR